MYGARLSINSAVQYNYHKSKRALSTLQDPIVLLVAVLVSKSGQKEFGIV